MKKKLIMPKCIVTANEKDDVLWGKALVIENGKIESIVEAGEYLKKQFKGEVLEFPTLTLIPGFVQTHVHMCQTIFRGLADDLLLLDWLQQRIFPFENAHSAESLRASAQLSLLDFQTGGTTTILDMGTINHQEVLFDEFIKSGQRGFSGKCMMDENDLMPKFKEDKNQCLRRTEELAREFHNCADGRIKYAFAPRFVLSCSENLMIETKEMMKEFSDSLYHTHSSENKSEIAAVMKKFGKENIEYFNSISVLDSNTVLAHCIHLNEKEKQILSGAKTRVVHCPSANLKLGSGIADIPDYLQRKISVSLGADGAPCNNNLSMFTEMKHAALIQKPIHGPTAMNAKTVFRLATIEGAKALHLENEIGSIEPGKKADLVLLDLEKADQCLLDSDENIFSSVVYSANKSNVREVMIESERVVSNGKSLLYDETKVFSDAKEQLKDLLKRI